MAGQSTINIFMRFAPIVALAAALCASCKHAPKQETIAEEVEQTDSLEHSYEYGICVDSLNVTNYLIRSGDNLSAIFGRLGFSANATDSLCRASSRLIDPKKIVNGMNYATITTRDSMEAIQYIIFAKLQSKTDFAVIDLTGDSIQVYPYHKEFRVERRYMEAVVESSLWNVIKANGETPLLALTISDIFAWQIDFFEIRKGDSFRALYDVAIADDSTTLRIASVAGLVFKHQGKEFTAIPFAQDNVLEYFDVDGKGLRKTFLKAPLDFFRITSHFSNARFHPILKRYRAHHGVDYAAPVGTPVKAIGDGAVVAKGYDGKGGGNYVKIKHNSVYTTTYMHLSKFGKGVQTGAHVRQGAVIGYVGSTGLSTGPHLDFRVHKNGQPINPLHLESPPSEPVKPALRDSFEVVKQRVLAEMSSYASSTENN